MQIIQTRRQFVTGLSAATMGVAGLPASLHAEPPPETTTVRIAKYRGPAVCEAPKYVAAELLRAEGFTDIRYMEDTSVDNIDFDTDFAPGWINSIETSVEPWTVLAGLHSGCLQLVANHEIHVIPDLRGKRIGEHDKTFTGYRLAMIVLSYVGLDPNKDVEWVFNDKVPLVELLAEGKIDAFLGSPPDPQEVLARGIGHSILDTTFDDPWSHLYCCMLGGKADFARKHPIATKRVVRAFLKAVDICRAQPAMAARTVVDYGINEKYDYTLQGLTEVRYDQWRDLDPEDALRFYALRMREIGFIQSSPQQIIAKGADFRFFGELRHELKM
jgi:NitT/TauT family transport system substrate-binding protein